MGIEPTSEAWEVLNIPRMRMPRRKYSCNKFESEF